MLQGNLGSPRVSDLYKESGPDSPTSSCDTHVYMHYHCTVADVGCSVKYT